MRRHYSNYFKGVENFKEYRTRLVTAATLDEVMGILDEITNNPRYQELDILSH